jgi:hypothetical protein
MIPVKTQAISSAFQLKNSHILASKQETGFANPPVGIPKKKLKSVKLPPIAAQLT